MDLLEVLREFTMLSHQTKLNRLEADKQIDKTTVPIYNLSEDHSLQGELITQGGGSQPIGGVP